MPFNFMPNEVLSLAPIILSVLGGLLILVMGLAYALLRYRDAHNPVKDPHIGIKTALHYFLTTSVFMVLIGASFVAHDVMTKGAKKAIREANQAKPVKAEEDDEFMTRQVRSGLAMATTGGAFALLNFVLLLISTNDLRWPMARRVFVGYRFAIHSLVVILIVSFLINLLFENPYPKGADDKQKESIDRDQHLKYMEWLSFLVVWGPSWILHLILLRLYSAQAVTPAASGSSGGRRDEPEDYAPAPPPPPPPRRRPM
jgi:hypothetical protein